jgi:DNA polymerase/3'-5' exonuclease PolX
MSTGTKRSLSQATADAAAFVALFEGCYEVWTVAGSVRRRKPEVGDVEHVVMPKMGEVEVSGGLFPVRKVVNLLWHRLDGLIADGTLQKHVYQTIIGNQSRWGDKYRGVDFRGFNHEIFTAEKSNFGSVLLIRTGPADYSQAFVTRILAGGMYRQQDGYLVHIGTGEIVPIPDEETYCKMAGMPHISPERRR